VTPAPAKPPCALGLGGRVSPRGAGVVAAKEVAAKEVAATGERLHPTLAA